jgi:hypothetical protein
MNASKPSSTIKDRQAILSTLWIFTVLNYLYADFVTIVFSPGAYQKIAAGLSPVTVLGLAALLEVAIAMVLFSRVLSYRANRWANILAGIESTLFVAVTLSGASPYYLFFAFIEIAATLFIIWYAWTWPTPQRLGE